MSCIPLRLNSYSESMIGFLKNVYVPLSLHQQRHIHTALHAAADEGYIAAGFGVIPIGKRNAGGGVTQVMGQRGDQLPEYRRVLGHGG